MIAHLDGLHRGVRPRGLCVSLKPHGTHAARQGDGQRRGSTGPSVHREPPGRSGAAIDVAAGAESCVSRYLAVLGALQETFLDQSGESQLAQPLVDAPETHGLRKRERQARHLGVFGADEIADVANDSPGVIANDRRRTVMGCVTFHAIGGSNSRASTSPPARGRSMRRHCEFLRTGAHLFPRPAIAAAGGTADRRLRLWTVS